MKTKTHQNDNKEFKMVELIKRMLKECDDYDKTQSNNKVYDGILTEGTGAIIKQLLPDLYSKYFA
jgi:hypothetical protein